MVAQIQADVLRILVEQGALQLDQADKLKENIREDHSIYDLLHNVIDDETIAQALAASAQLPYVDLRMATIPRDVLYIIPETTAREHMIIAYEQTDQALNVAMLDPSDRQIVDFIHKKVATAVGISIASPTSFKRGLNQYRQSLSSEVQEILTTSSIPDFAEGGDLSKAAEDLPIIKITDLVLRHAILEDASDIHIEPGEKNLMVRYRIDGILHDVLTLQPAFGKGIVARIKILSNLKIDEHRLPQDGRFKVETQDYRIAFRVSILPVYDGEKVVMRLLDESGRGYDMQELGMQADMLEIFRRNIHKPHGMVLVTGPTGSGKTTTLYAALKELNTADVNISTVEDPIEYRIARINQTQVNPQIGLMFSNGLRALVRQDPDILMVGEIRDEETASLAVNAALTGHLVLSTLHTNSAAGALPRLLDMKVESFLISSTVNLLLAQRLVRRLCAECRQETTLGDTMVNELKKLIDIKWLEKLLVDRKIIAEGTDLKTLKICQPVGCSLCTNGYKGRVGIYEMIEFTKEIADIMSPHISSNDLEKAAREQQNMITMIEDGLIKVAQGVTTMEEVARATKE